MLFSNVRMYCLCCRWIRPLNDTRYNFIPSLCRVTSSPVAAVVVVGAHRAQAVAVGPPCITGPPRPMDRPHRHDCRPAVLACRCLRPASPICPAPGPVGLCPTRPAPHRRPCMDRGRTVPSHRHIR